MIQKNSSQKTERGQVREQFKFLFLGEPLSFPLADDLDIEALSLREMCEIVKLYDNLLAFRRMEVNWFAEWAFDMNKSFSPTINSGNVYSRFRTMFLDSGREMPIFDFLLEFGILVYPSVETLVLSQLLHDVGILLSCHAVAVRQFPKAVWLHTKHLHDMMPRNDWQLVVSDVNLYVVTSNPDFLKMEVLIGGNRDCFSETHSGFYSDPVLAIQALKEKIEKHAQSIKKFYEAVANLEGMWNSRLNSAGYESVGMYVPKRSSLSCFMKETISGRHFLDELERLARSDADVLAEKLSLQNLMFLFVNHSGCFVDETQARSFCMGVKAAYDLSCGMNIDLSGFA